MVKRNSTVYDLGAHVGYYTLLASVLVGPLGKVFAFEPLPDNLRILQRHLEINNIDNVEVLPVACSNKMGSARFEVGPSSSMGRLSEDGTIEVPTTYLDFLVFEQGYRPPNYIKIDIEGAEFLALSGGERVLSTFHPFLFLSTHGPEVHKACCSLLASLGYSLHPIDAWDVERATELFALYAQTS